jgi:Resolvase, N terminal domain
MRPSWLRGSSRPVTISGSVTASERPGFAKLLERLEDSDVLVVTKPDRLGRNAMDARATVELLSAGGVKVDCLVFRAPIGQPVSASAKIERLEPVFCVGRVKLSLIT